MNWYQKGAFHRDISIGNILKLDKPAKRKPFTVSSLQELFTQFGSMQKLGNIDLEQLTHRIRAVQRLLKDIDELREKLDEQVAKLNIGDMCSAVVTDADCAADLKKNYFEGEHEGTISVRVACPMSSCADERCT